MAEIESVPINLDVYYPLAGKTLHIDVAVVEQRPVTNEELSHGHVPGQGHAHKLDPLDD